MRVEHLERIGVENEEACETEDRRRKRKSEGEEGRERGCAAVGEEEET